MQARAWLPLVLGPAFAMDSTKGACEMLKFSSAKVRP